MSLSGHILTVVGARPQFIKAAPVSRALRAAGLKEHLLHTGQHYDAAMSAQFFDELDMPTPTHQLGINRLDHGAMTGRMLEAIEQVILRERPALVLVYGDTNSTLAGALAAAKLHIPVAHVEAGLRSFNRTMPEEINRVLTDHLSRLLFCPTEASVAHLQREGITQGVMHVGDVMMDATLQAAERAATASSILQQQAITPGHYRVCTLHRAENTDDPNRLRQWVSWLEAEAAAQAGPILWPMHPRTAAMLKEHGLTLQRVRTIAPLGYLDMVQLVRHASHIYTDSGGLQKEAYFHRVPCVTLREETEWVETIEAGWNRLWKTPEYQPRRDISDYGNGHASQRIAEQLAQMI